MLKSVTVHHTNWLTNPTSHEHVSILLSRLVWNSRQLLCLSSYGAGEQTVSTSCSAAAQELWPWRKADCSTQWTHLSISQDTQIAKYYDWSLWVEECREVWTLAIACLEGNSKIRLRQAVDQVPFYQRSVLSFTLKIYLLCNYGQFWEVQMLRDLHVDLGLEDKVKSTYTVHVELSVCQTIWL